MTNQHRKGLARAQIIAEAAIAEDATDSGCVVGKQETMGFWSQNHFTLIPRSLESLNAGRPTQIAATFGPACGLPMCNQFFRPRSTGVRSEAHTTNDRGRDRTAPRTPRARR